MARFYVGDQDLGEFDEFTNKEWSRLKKVAGLTPAMMAGEDAEAYSIDAMTAIVYTLRRRNGEPNLRWDDVEFKPSQVRQELSPEEQAQQAQAEAETVEPVMRRICERLGIDLGDTDVQAIVVEEWQAHADEAAGKDRPQVEPPG